MKRKEQHYIDNVRKSIDNTKELERNLYIEAVAKKTARTVKIALIITTIITILVLLA